MTNMSYKVNDSEKDLQIQVMGMGLEVPVEVPPQHFLKKYVYHGFRSAPIHILQSKTEDISTSKNIRFHPIKEEPKAANTTSLTCSHSKTSNSIF